MYRRFFIIFSALSMYSAVSSGQAITVDASISPQLQKALAQAKDLIEVYKKQVSLEERTKLANFLWAVGRDLSNNGEINPSRSGALDQSPRESRVLYTSLRNIGTSFVVPRGPSGAKVQRFTLSPDGKTFFQTVITQLKE